MPSLRISTAVALVSLLISGAASAAEPKSLGQFRDWEAFVASDGGGKVCYAVSSPKKSEGKYSKRDPVLLMVARRPADKVYDEGQRDCRLSIPEGQPPRVSGW